MFDLLRLFLQVAEEESYSTVARKLGISQPAVSNQIRVLEEKLGVKMFARKGRSFALTSQGEIVRQYAMRILNNYEALLTELQPDQSKLIGKVHIGASNIPGEYILPFKLKQFQLQNPDVHIKITIGDSMDMAEKLQGNEVDFAVVGANFDTEKLSSAFWFKDELHVVLPTGHPLSKQEHITAEELINYPMIVREVGSGHRRALEEALLKIGLKLDSFRIGLEAGSTEAVKNSVRSGLGYSFLSESALKLYQDAELWTGVVKGLSIQRGFYILTRRDRQLSRVAQKCHDFLFS